MQVGINPNEFLREGIGFFLSAGMNPLYFIVIQLISLKVCLMLKSANCLEKNTLGGMHRPTILMKNSEQKPKKWLNSQLNLERNTSVDEYFR